MRWLKLLLLGTAVLALAERVPAPLLESGLAPRWFLLPALLAGLLAPPGRALLLGWGSGLLADLLSLSPLGWHAFLYGGAALLLARVRRAVFSEHPLTQAVAGFGLTFLVLLLGLLRLKLAEPALHLAPRLPAALLSSLATAALLPLLFLLEERVGFLRGFTGRGPARR